MDRRVDALDAAEVERLVDALGEASAVTYAPPNVYPMSAPVFDPAPVASRGAPPAGPLGVYAHVPFCNYKCTFCFYATRNVPDRAELERYVAALARELDGIPPGTPLTQLYVGGGTPTALPADLLDRLLRAIFARVVPSDEVNTVECSPESLAPEHLDVLRDHGIERVSMGVQSNDARVLASTHRRHDRAQVERAARRVVEAGLLLNVDLIYGLPGQTPESFAADLATAVDLGAHAVTCYNLRVNEWTSIARLLPEEARLDAIRLVRWREAVQAAAAAAGLRQTRWHTFRREAPGTARDAARRFRDATGWGNQYGVGVSARSRLDGTVYRNRKDYGAYVAAIEAGESPVDEVRTLDDHERRLRHLTLTLGDGLPLDRAGYARAFGTRFDDDFGVPLRRLVDAGVAHDDGVQVELTARGRLVYDLAIRAFYPASVRRWMEERQRLVETAPNLRPRTR